MKKTSFIFGLLVAIVTLVACSGGAPTSGPENTKQTSQALTPSGDLVFTPGTVGPQWLPVSSLDLTPAFVAARLPETGLGYFTIGAPTLDPPFADRFNPSAPTYLTFFGGYVLDNFPFASDWENADGSQKTNMQVSDVTNSANELVKLGNADQFFWLSAFPPAPIQSAELAGSLVILPAQDAGFSSAWNGWFLLSFEVNTIAELGADPSTIFFSGCGFESIPGVPCLYPPYSTFSSLVPAFAPYVAEALVLIHYDVAHHNFLAVYGNGANWHTNDGKDHNTPLSTILQITTMMSQVTFQ